MYVVNSHVELVKSHAEFFSFAQSDAINTFVRGNARCPAEETNSYLCNELIRSELMTAANRLSIYYAL